MPPTPDPVPIQGLWVRSAALDENLVEVLVQVNGDWLLVGHQLAGPGAVFASLVLSPAEIRAGELDLTAELRRGSDELRLTMETVDA